jgi:hypothetical protein
MKAKRGTFWLIRAAQSVEVGQRSSLAAPRHSKRLHNQYSLPHIYATVLVANHITALQ